MVNLINCSSNDIVEDVQSSLDYKLISDNDLQDWDMGIMSDSFILLAAPKDNCFYYLVQSRSTENGDFLLFKFNEEGELEEISNRENCIYVTHDANGANISWFTTNGDLCGTIINCQLPAITINNNSRSDIISWFAPDNLAAIGDIIQNLVTLEKFGLDLFTFDQVKFLQDLRNCVIDGGLNLAPQPLGIMLSSLKGMIDGLNESLYKRQKKAMYGDCEIIIEDITNDEKGKLNISVSIRNANSIPSHLYQLLYDEPEDVTSNTVYWGIVGKNGFVPYKKDYTAPYAELKLLDTSKKNTQHFLITYPMPEKGEKYYFRAFLLSTRLSKSIDNINDNHILYSDNYVYSSLNAYITNFSQYSNEVKGETVSIDANVSGFIKSVENISEWGFYYLDDNGKYEYFPSDYSYSNPTDVSGISSPNEYSDHIHINLTKSSFVNKHKNIKLGIYTKDFNFTYKEWSEPQSFEVHYNDEMPNLAVSYNTLECKYSKKMNFNVKLCGDIVLSNDERVLEDLEESFISWNMEDGSSLFVQKLSVSRNQSFTLQNVVNSNNFKIDYTQFSASLQLYPQYHYKFRDEEKSHIKDLSPVKVVYQEQPNVTITDAIILDTSQNGVDGLGWFYVTKIKINVKLDGIFWIKDMCFQIDGSDGWNNCFPSHPTGDVYNFYEITHYQYDPKIETDRVGFYNINLYGGKQIQSSNSILLKGNPISNIFVM